MNDTIQRQDLIVVVADLDIQMTLESLLKRTKSLGIQTLSVQIDRFAGRDSGCYSKVHDYLRPFMRQFDYALVVFDRQGCGKEQLPREEIEKQVEARLARNGWANRSAVIVLDPELEIWVWSKSPEVAAVLGWSGRNDELWTWLIEQGHIKPGAEKPSDPKKAFKRVLRTTGKRFSASLFEQLASRVGVGRCTDKALEKLKTTLQQWFPAKRKGNDP